MRMGGGVGVWRVRGWSLKPQGPETQAIIYLLLYIIKVVCKKKLSAKK